MIKAVRALRVDKPESLTWTLPTRGGADGPELQPLSAVLENLLVLPLLKLSLGHEGAVA